MLINIAYQFIDLSSYVHVHIAICDYGKFCVFFSTPESIAICEIKCSGYETQLIDCGIIQSCDHDFNYCTHNDDIAVSCCKAIFSFTI